MKESRIARGKLVSRRTQRPIDLPPRRVPEAMREACFLVSQTGNVSKPVGEEVNELECHDDEEGLEQKCVGFEHDCEELENGEALDMTPVSLRGRLVSM
jgi:hypothetical protein